MGLKQMDCIDLVELVTDCLEEAVDNETLMAVLDHLPACKGCDDYFNEVLVTLKVVSNAAPEQLPADLEAKLLGKYREWVESSVVA